VTAWFLIQGLIIYTVGIKLFLHLHSVGGSEIETTIACLVVCVLTVIATAEVFYRLVEIPSKRFAKAAFEWMRV
jgi:peptidoglycan/LPS O-acetylase OafA/YrhL